MNKAEVMAPVVLLHDLRQLEEHELVTAGDFVAAGEEGFEPWAGPTGFRADAFIKPVYRRNVPSTAKN